MKESRSKRPLSGAAFITHALKEHGPENTMLSGIQRIADEAYGGGHKDGYQEGFRDGYQHGVVETFSRLFGNRKNNQR